MKTRSMCMCCGVAMVAWGTVGTALGQYVTGFETADGITASTGGTVLTAQDSYYIPQGTNSTDYLAYIYSGNALGVATNPNGGEQFVAVEGPGGGTYGRAQRDINWGAGTATASYDVAAVYTGQAPSSNNIGSFSVQPYPGTADYIHLFTYPDTNDPTIWQAGYMAFDAGGAQYGAPGNFPGPEWTGLATNHWYNFVTKIDFTLNQIVEVSITDLTTNVTTTVQPTDFFLEGGSAGGFPLPTGFRMFSGGGAVGNVAAFDNMSITIVDVAPFDLLVDMPNGCPGPITVSWTGSPGNGQQALVVGNSLGSTTIPQNQPCTGTVLGIQGQVQLVDPPGFFSNQGGSGSISGQVSNAGVCGRYLQLVKGGTCETSTVAQIQ